MYKEKEKATEAIISKTEEAKKIIISLYSA